MSRVDLLFYALMIVTSIANARAVSYFNRARARYEADLFWRLAQEALQRAAWFEDAGNRTQAEAWLERFRALDGASLRASAEARYQGILERARALWTRWRR